jgi:hypothetical protein
MSTAIGGCAVHDQDAVGAAGGADAVRDDDQCPAGAGGESLLRAGFGRGVEMAGGLVEQYEGRGCEMRPRQCQQLPFSGGQ